MSNKTLIVINIALTLLFVLSLTLHINRVEKDFREHKDHYESNRSIFLVQGEEYVLYMLESGGKLLGEYEGFHMIVVPMKQLNDLAIDMENFQRKAITKMSKMRKRLLELGEFDNDGL